jgi:hypothetical protein
VSDVVTTSARVRVVPPGPPEGIVALTRRFSELGIGAASISLDAVLDAVDRFLPAESAGRREPTMLRELARAATGMAIATEQRALDAAEMVELTTQRAVAFGGQVPIVRDVLVGFGSFVGRWAARADVEQARRRAVTTDFFARLVPAVADALVERIDVAAIVRRVPLAEIVAAVDVDAVLDQVDLDAILAHVDVGALLGRIDVDALMARVDIDALLQRVDIGALMARIDVNSVVTRIDADALVRRVDANALIGRVDVTALIERVDLTPVVAEVLDEVDIGAVIRESTGSITNDAVDGARLTAMRLDGFVGRVADKVLLRRTSDRFGLPPAAPPDPPGGATGSVPPAPDDAS